MTTATTTETTETTNPPRTFKDSKGREWDLKLTLGKAKRIDASDFSEITDFEFTVLEPKREFFAHILEDPNLCFAIAWVIILDQVKDKMGIDLDEEGLSDEQREERQAKAEWDFVDSLDGDAMLKGREALMGAFSDFFPEIRTVLSTLMVRWKTAYQRMGNKLKGLGPEIDNMIEAEMEKGLTDLMNRLKTETGTDKKGAND